MPRRSRSSGMWPRPDSSRSRALPFVISLSASLTRPSVARLSPVRASTSSVCPLPSTPAIPTISPARTLKLTPRTAGRPRSSSTVSPSTSRSVSPGLAGSLSTCRTTSRPTIKRARPCSVAPSRGTASTSFPRRSTLIRSAISAPRAACGLMKITDIPSARQRFQDREEVVALAAVSAPPWARRG